MTLDQVPAGGRVAVARVDGDDALARRLGDFGFRPGTPVVVRRRAPFGDPAQIDLRGYRVALRKDEARRVVVTETP